MMASENEDIAAICRLKYRYARSVDLRDFAAIQKSKQKMWGYKRAAAAVLALEEPIESLLEPAHGA